MYNDTHPNITTGQEVADITQPFLDKHDLNYFQHLRVFDDGSFNVLCNRPDWISFAAKTMVESDAPAVYSHISEKEELDKQSYWFLWNNNLPDWPVGLAREFNLYNGLTFVERFSDHYTMTAFAAPDTNTGILNFYINQIDLLKNYIEQFKANHYQLISEIDNNKVHLKPKNQDQNLERMLLKTKQTTQNIPTSFQGQAGYLTPQEARCLNALTKGNTYKTIAKQLNISPRTVETYIQRIKSRFNLTNRQQLVQLYQSLSNCP